MTGRIVVGKIFRAHGVRGEVKVFPLTDDSSRFLRLKKVFCGNEELTVNSAKIIPQGVVLSFVEITDRNAAETLVGLEISVDRKDAVPLEAGRYFIADVIGCSVFDGTKTVGIVKDVLQGRAADVYVLDDNGTRIMFPAAPGVILGVDTERKIVSVDAKKLGEVAIYED